MGDLIGQTIAIAALAAAGVLRAGDVLATNDGRVCLYDGARVRPLPAWAGPATLGAFCGRLVSLAALCKSPRRLPGIVESWS